MAASMSEPSYWRGIHLVLVCVCIFSLVDRRPAAREERGMRPLCRACLCEWECSECLGSVWPATYTHVVCTCTPVHVSAGNTSPGPLLVGPGDMERQQLHLSWPVGSSTIYLPQKVRMQIGGKNP